MANISTEPNAIQASPFADNDVDAEAVWIESTILQHHNQPTAQDKATDQALTRKNRAEEVIDRILALMDEHSDLLSRTRLSIEAKTEIIGALQGTKLVTKAEFYGRKRIESLTTRKKVFKDMTQAKLQCHDLDRMKAEIKQLELENWVFEIREAQRQMRYWIWLVNIVKVCLILGVVELSGQIYSRAFHSQPSGI
ncbi:MAG: hypothetical protein Q9208_006582 [Pyrenodesmia sp. 3 TL-2023]